METIKQLKQRVCAGEALGTDQLSKFNALTTPQLKRLLKNGKVKIAKSTRQYLTQIVDDRKTASENAINKWNDTAKQKSLWVKFQDSSRWRVYNK